VRDVSFTVVLALGADTSEDQARFELEAAVQSMVDEFNRKHATPWEPDRDDRIGDFDVLLGDDDG
jgi:hypothetical protein